MKKNLLSWNKNRITLGKLIAEESVNHFTLNFKKQGFVDSGVKKWKARKSKKDKGRGILIGKGSGRKLSRSIRTIKVTKRFIIVGSNIKYAGVHNKGLRSGRGKGFTMPQRQFIGHSKALNRKIIKLIHRKLNQSFR